MLGVMIFERFCPFFLAVLPSPLCLSPLTSCSASRLRSVAWALVSTQKSSTSEIGKRKKKPTKFFWNCFSYFPIKKKKSLQGWSSPLSVSLINWSKRLPRNPVIILIKNIVVSNPIAIDEGFFPLLFQSQPFGNPFCISAMTQLI